MLYDLVRNNLNFYLLTPTHDQGGGGSAVKILKFWPINPASRGGGGNIRWAKYLLPCFCIRDSLQFDMQHDHVLKKLNFDPLTTTPRLEGRCVCGQNICYHVAAFRDAR